MQWIADLLPVLYLVRDCIVTIIALFAVALIGWGVQRTTWRMK